MSSAGNSGGEGCYCQNNNEYYTMFGKLKICETKITNGKKEVPKTKKTLRNCEIRKEEVMAIKTRFPNKVPVIVQRFHKERYLPQLEKTKFLVPQDITMSQFQTIIRNRIRISNPNQAMYLLINERSMLSMSLTVGEAYSEFSGPSGFLHITYASQEVFGSDLRN